MSETCKNLGRNSKRAARGRSRNSKESNSGHESYISELEKVNSALRDRLATSVKRAENSEKKATLLKEHCNSLSG